MAHYYTMSQDKLDEVVRLVNEHQAVGEESVADFVLGDWPEGQEHQDWLDSAEPAEIADWFLSGYEPEPDEEVL